jgi:hypothetical protein
MKIKKELVVDFPIISKKGVYLCTLKEDNWYQGNYKKFK